MGAAAGLAAGGGILNAYSQLQAGKAQVKAANRQQAYLNTQANEVINQGDYQSDLTIQQGRQVAASQKTGYAANGVAVGTGTAQRVQDSTVDLSVADAQQVRKNAFNQAFGLVTQGNEITKQAKANYKTTQLNALGSLLGGGAQAYRFMQ
jgi:hypothetical protein